ncbi:endolytic transglycosylase MltG, partial [Bacteroidota bacterium]
NNRLNNNNLVNLLRAGANVPLNVTFNNLRTKEQLAGRVSKLLETDSVSIINIINDSTFLEEQGFNEYTIPSLFIPNTYEFFWNTSAEQFLQRMIKEYNTFWTPERIRKAEESGFSRVDISIIASITECETLKNDEKPTIAGVYINRIKKGMKLQADPTVVFAVGDFTLRRVLNKHLRVDSPYNTYKYKGLPPGPIKIPSIASIDAVLNYQDHNYIFFCAREDFSGYHNFASTLTQHNRNSRAYHKALRERDSSQ